MKKFISVIVPNHNGSATIGKCLEAAFASAYENFEVVVVDDCSSDNSTSIIKRFPCRLIELKTHAGAAKARNEGALAGKGEVFFFTDADCLLQANSLALANSAINEAGTDAVIGGTYTRLPLDKDFFSTFQSIFIHYSEAKNCERPDYIATHAMIISAETFRRFDGFKEDFMPILEDVEFSHRLYRGGCRLLMDPEITVRHIFAFTLKKSFLNAYRKARYWTIYSIRNRDMLADSGTASRELKVNGISYLACLLFLLLSVVTLDSAWLIMAAVFTGLNIFAGRGLLAQFRKTGGPLFALKAALYYLLLYPLPVLAGSLSGVMEYARHR
ncbi:MAG: glycosyltransferase family 2 protein [Nitrospirae bacterium]|nr:glycosyltransferase family 2 protein [Nitrospirota bacterium]